MSGKRAHLGIAFAAAVVAAVLIAFAVVLVDQQSDDRNEIEDGYRDRATVSAALTESLFEASSSLGQEQNARLFGTREVSPEALARQAQQNQATFLAVVDEDGSLLASSPGTPAPVLDRLRTTPEDVRAVLDGASFGLSNLLELEGGVRTLEFATAFETDFGRRVLVSGSSPELIAVFLGGYLAKVPNVEGGVAYLLDGNDVSLAATGPGAAPGSMPDDPALIEAVGGGGEQGSFGDDQFFVSAPVQGSPWKVVSTAPESTLFDSVSGSHKWVPWLIFTLLAIASAAALVLLTRVLRSAGELEEANAKLADANDALERRAKELGRSNAELEQFASIASHDLKEPLRKMQTLTELLARKEGERLSDEGRDYMARIDAAGDRMQSLIDDLLRFSRVATQGQPFEPVDLTDVANKAVFDLEAPIEESGATVEVDDLPTVAADPLQMRQLLQNLISNAIKFRREGVPPEIRVEGQTRGRFAELSVADNGIGFEPKYNARIFRVFERLHGRGSYPGTGIGLALCRKIVDRHGGTITAGSVPGEGSTFTITLPIAARAESAHEPSLNGDRVESVSTHA